MNRPLEKEEIFHVGSMYITVLETKHSEYSGYFSLTFTSDLFKYRLIIESKEN